jgi:hypothetical protein
MWFLGIKEPSSTPKPDSGSVGGGFVPTIPGAWVDDNAEPSPTDDDNGLLRWILLHHRHSRRRSYSHHHG